MRLKHILMTRFNIYTKYSVSDGVFDESGEDIIYESDEEYLTYRFNLFEKYTLPSVSAQKNVDFVWFVFFSDRLPTAFKDRVDMISKQNSVFRPIYLSRQNSFYEEKFNKIVHTILTDEGIIEKGEILISTRIDNDDAIADDYLYHIEQTCLESKREYPYAIFFENGVQLDLNRGMVCKHIYWTSAKNHFFSIVNAFSMEYKYPLNVHHGKVDEEMEVISVFNTPVMWMEIVHGRNIVNVFSLSINNFFYKYRELDRFKFEYKYQYRNRLYVLSILLIIEIQKRLPSISRKQKPLEFRF